MTSNMRGHKLTVQQFNYTPRTEESSIGRKADHTWPIWLYIGHFSGPSVEVPLKFFHKIWVLGKMQEHWKNRVIVAFWKPGKPPTSRSSYRPMAFTSCLAKTYECVGNIRLSFVLRSKLLGVHQCGFKKACSTTDHLFCLENTIREAVIHKQLCLAVFFYLEKAFETTWRCGIVWPCRIRHPRKNAELPERLHSKPFVSSVPRLSPLGRTLYRRMGCLRAVF